MINFKTYLKGFLMGTCDLVPGISGGTIAFITGIYYKLIESVKGFSFQLILDIFKYLFRLDKKNNSAKIKEDIKKLNLGFLFALLLGIFSAIILLSGGISYLLENHFAYTMSFFVGLISYSSYIIYRNIKNHKFSNIIFGLIGLLVAIPIIILKPISVADPSYFYLFLGGFFGISAMFLPGISGAFILLIMGLYEHVLGLLRSLQQNIFPLAIFCLGLILGAFFISRLISFLFKANKCRTLYFLLGLVVGSLAIPLKEINNNLTINFINLNLILIFILLGILTVLTIDFFRIMKEKRDI